jgi:hypothetical protein
MPAYSIVYRETTVRDPAEMQQYQANARQLGGGWNLTPRVLEGAVTPRPGTRALHIMRPCCTARRLPTIVAQSMARATRVDDWPWFRLLAHWT